MPTLKAWLALGLWSCQPVTWLPVVVVELPAEGGVHSARARVVHSTSQAGGTFLVGCTFDTQLGDAEVQALAR